MDTSLHCNDLSCRSLCPDRAVVTTCSHIFCLPCADRLGLSAPKDGRRQCPACASNLDNLDDAVVTSLNPTEDYKTSILSGFSPTVIMECAGRGLSFWNYQMAQEITYQAYLARSMTDKYSALNSHLDNTVREANDESQKLSQKIDVLSADLAHLVENNQRLNDELRKKTRHAEYYLAEWQKLKQLHMTADVGAAAEHTAENVVQETAAYSQRIANHERPLGMPPYRSTSKGSVGSGGDRQRRMTRAFATGDHQNYAREYHPQSSRAGFGTSQSFPNATQSQGNRQQLPMPAYGQYATRAVDGHGTLHQGTPRASMGNSYPPTGQSGYKPSNNPSNNPGISSNMRAGQKQHTMPQSRMAGGYSGLHVR